LGSKNLERSGPGPGRDIMLEGVKGRHGDWENWICFYLV